MLALSNCCFNRWTDPPNQLLELHSLLFQERKKDRKKERVALPFAKLPFKRARSLPHFFLGLLLRLLSFALPFLRSNRFIRCFRFQIVSDSVSSVECSRLAFHH